jgi:hypothetical protein
VNDESAALKSRTSRFCARRRSAGPDVRHDLPRAVYLALLDDYVTAFGFDFSAADDVGERLLQVAAVVSQIATRLQVLAVQREVAGEAGQDRLEERAPRRGADDAVAVGLQERGGRSIKLQNWLELFRAQALHPCLTQFRQGFQG